MNSSLNRLFGAMLLVAGTCIGAGMLALPIMTSTYSIVGAISASVICWLFMCFTGLLVLEMNLRIGVGSNFISMVQETLGAKGKQLAWGLYLLLLYSLLAAYLTGGGTLLQSLLLGAFHVYASVNICTVIIALFVGLILYGGIKSVDYINRFLVLMLIISYAGLIFLIAPHVGFDNYTAKHAAYFLLALPTVLTCFGFHVVIPSLTRYLDGHVKRIRYAIVGGSVIALLIYLLWQIIIIGVIPHGHSDSSQILAHSTNPTQALVNALVNQFGNTQIVWLFKLLGISALASSFLGIALSLFDFLADAHKTSMQKHKVRLLLEVFLPPLVFAFIYPHGFIVALTYAGIILVVLQGLLPLAMVWKSRQCHITQHSYVVKGGALSLSVSCCVALIIIISQIVAMRF